MTLLVTGGCGLVGSFAVRRALEMGEKVVAFDIALKTWLLEDIKDQVTLVRGNLLTPPDLYRAVAENGVDKMLHTASFLTPGAYEDPYNSAELTIMGTLNVLECARANNIKRVAYVSTGKTGWVGDTFAKSNNTGELDFPADPYGSAKVGAELLCNDYRKLYGMDVLILRLMGQVFGPGKAFTGAVGQGLQALVEEPLKGNPVSVDTVILPHSAPVMPMLYARDAGEGIAQAVLNDNLQHYVFDIAGQELCTLEELVEVIKEVIPGADITVPPSALKGGPMPYDERAAAQFDYTPKYSAKRGLEEYVEYLNTDTYRQI
ncbi:MAG: hypothetical protein DRQ60_10855 [Gammaproteobacteria bacterium]|nr:MAG: hypothetical protein DRQ60_10855 [Gammaproteobacteria bacterium]